MYTQVGYQYLRLSLSFAARLCTTPLLCYQQVMMTLLKQGVSAMLLCAVPPKMVSDRGNKCYVMGGRNARTD